MEGSNKSILGDLFYELSNSYESDDYYFRVGELIHSKDFNENSLKKLVEEKRENQIISKDDGLDLVISYIKLILCDNVLSVQELKNVQLLKEVFGFAKGDFYEFRKEEVDSVITDQFKRMLGEGEGVYEDALLLSELLELFDLRDDQIEPLVSEWTKANIKFTRSKEDVEWFTGDLEY